MSMELMLPVLVTAFFAGLLGSGHCFGMCGGIAGGLGLVAGGAHQNAVGSAFAFNGGRLLSYALLGGLAALVFGGAGQTLDLPSWGKWLRVMTAVLILLIGVHFLFGWQALSWLEKAGGSVWARISPLAARAAAKPGWSGRLALGLCWGLLPCGLVYTLLLTAASTGAFPAGALVMLAFGLGTLPSMLGMSLAAPGIAAFLSDNWTRRLIGVALVLLAGWSLLLAFQSQAHVHG